MTIIIARPLREFTQVHMMNADLVPSGRQTSDQVNQLGL